MSEASEVIEAAKAVVEAWDNNDSSGPAAIERLRAALAAEQPEQREAVGRHGVKELLREPTPEMVAAGAKWEKQGFDWAKAMFRAMWDAAPPQPAQQPVQDAELSAALGWPGGISEPVVDRAALLRMVAERCRQPAQQTAVALRMTEEQVREYVDGYVLEGDDGCHTPTEGERFMLLDAIMGLTARDAAPPPAGREE